MLCSFKYGRPCKSS